MKFRLKKTFRNERHCLTTEPHAPSNPDLKDGDGGEDDNNNDELDTVDMKESGKKSRSRVILDLRLNHGDVVIMKGSRIQERCEVGSTICYLQIFESY
jgi:hypothetical protein